MGVVALRAGERRRLELPSQVKTGGVKLVSVAALLRLAIAR